MTKALVLSAAVSAFASGHYQFGILHIPASLNGTQQSSPHSSTQATLVGERVVIGRVNKAKKRLAANACKPFYCVEIYFGHVSVNCPSLSRSKISVQTTFYE